MEKQPGTKLSQCGGPTAVLNISSLLMVYFQKYHFSLRPVVDVPHYAKNLVCDPLHYRHAIVLLAWSIELMYQ